MRMCREQILTNFTDMIRLRTVSFDDPSKADREEFRRFRELLKERYPDVFSEGDAYLVGEYGIVIRIPGRESGDPAVLMAHYDVVPADGDGWETDPFEPVIRNGRIVGRGTLDTKCTLLSIMEAVQYCLQNGWKPSRDLILCFGGEEEPCGPCMQEITAFLKGEGVRPRLVLDEGGAVIPEGVPGLKRTAAMIGIAEKGTANYMLEIRDAKGGHASTPPKHTVIGRLAKAAVNIEQHPFPARLSSPVKLMFREIAKEADPVMRPLFLGAHLFSPAVSLLASCMGSSFHAMVRSTTAITIMEGRSSFNVLPDCAAMGINVRLLEGDTVESAAAYLKKVSGDPDAEIHVLHGTDPTGVSDIRCGEYDLLKKTIQETWPEAAVVPYQMNGGTDSRFFSELTDRIYKFSPMVMTKEERAMVHGKNESIAIDALFKMIVFYIRLIKKL